MYRKPFGKKVLTVILVIVISITPFSIVKGATTYTIDDLYIKLRDILTTLNGYGQNVPTEGINDQIQELQDLFDTIFEDNTYSYVDGHGGVVTNRTFMDLMEAIASLSFSIPATIMEGYYLQDSSGNIHLINGLSDKLQDIEDLLNTISYNDIDFLSYQLNRILDKLTDLLTNLNLISTTLSSILSVDTNILNLETNFYNYIQNGTFRQDLDNTIDTITWNTSISINHDNIGIRIDGTSDEYINQTIQLKNNDIILKLSLSNALQYGDRLFKLVIPYYIYSNSDTLPWELEITPYYSRYGYDIYYTSSRLGGIAIYFRIDAPQPITNMFFKISGNGTFTYLPNFTRQGLSYIESNDIEYWSLLNYINLHQLLKDYESVNSSELDKLKQQNTNLQTTLIDFNNIENNISTDFENSIVSFNGNLQESSSMFGRITSSVTWFSAQMQNVFNISSDFKMLLIMPMILGIALWFIGRGSFVLRSASGRSRKNKKGG